MSFCGLIKGISPKICILCVRVKINKRSFESFCVWILFENASSHFVSDFILFFYSKTAYTTRHDVTDSKSANSTRHDVTDSKSANSTRHDVTDSKSANTARHDVTDSKSANTIRHDVTDSIRGKKPYNLIHTGTFYYKWVD